MRRFALTVVTASLFFLIIGLEEPAMAAPAMAAPAQADGSYYVEMSISLDSQGPWEIRGVRHFPWSTEFDDEPELLEADARLIFRDRAGLATHTRLIARAWICNGHCEETTWASTEIPAQPNAVVAELWTIDAAGEPVELKASLARSPGVPVVEILRPAPGGRIADGTVIEWRGTDSDGDVLEYDVLYRPSVGEWDQLPLVIGSKETSYVFERGSLPADPNATIAVVANDGFNTTEATVDGLILEGNQAPEIYITSPSNGDSYYLGSNVILLAYADDPEDGELPVTWTSDLDGVITEENWTTGSQGRHVLTVSAQDSGGLEVSETRTIYIGVDPPSKVFLPLARNNY